MPNYNGGATKSLLQRRYILSMRKDDNEMDYELTKPKLIVDYTVAEQKNKYEFTTADYPDLAKCKWLLIAYKKKTLDLKTYVNLSVNNKLISRFEPNNAMGNIYLWELHGLLFSEVGQHSNISFVDSRLTFTQNSGITQWYKFEPITSINLETYTVDNFDVGSTIKIYGFY